MTGWRGGYAGYRGYAKLYFGDFDEDGKHDIVVWRKLYLSHLRDESEQGFKKVRETLLQYSLIDGEYRRQATEEPAIAQWLAQRELTWSKGFPSVSECSGEEGQPIAEMHDPMLNDPDVLK